MRPGNLQAQVPRTNAFWFADRGARQRLTKGFLANKGRCVLRLRRTDRTRIIAESQGNASFPLADSQEIVMYWSRADCLMNFCTQSAHSARLGMQSPGPTEKILFAFPRGAFPRTFAVVSLQSPISADGPFLSVTPNRNW